MIEKAKIQDLVAKTLATPEFSEKEAFIVEITVSQDNNIFVSIDALKNITIEDCITITKIIKKEFDQDFENYNLTVSSAGITEPFKVPQQFQKAIGKEIKIQTKDGKRHKGELDQYNQEYLTLKTKSKKQKELINTRIDLDQIKSAKQVISF